MREYQIPAYAAGVACSVAIFWSKLAREPKREDPEDKAEEKQDLKAGEDGQLALF